MNSILQDFQRQEGSGERPTQCTTQRPIQHKGAKKKGGRGIVWTSAVVHNFLRTHQRGRAYPHNPQDDSPAIKEQIYMGQIKTAGISQGQKKQLGDNHIGVWLGRMRGYDDVRRTYPVEITIWYLSFLFRITLFFQELYIKLVSKQFSTSFQTFSNKFPVTFQRKERYLIA